MPVLVDSKVNQGSKDESLLSTSTKDQAQIYMTSKCMSRVHILEIDR